MAEAAWQRVCGEPHDFGGAIETAERIGLAGEVALARLLVTRFEHEEPPPEHVPSRAADHADRPRPALRLSFPR